MDLSSKGINSLFSSVNQCNMMVEDAGRIRCADCGSTNECEEDSDNPGDYYCKHCWEEYNSEEEVCGAEIEQQDAIANSTSSQNENTANSSSGVDATLSNARAGLRAVRKVKQPVSYAEPSTKSKLCRGDVVFPKVDALDKNKVTGGGGGVSIIPLPGSERAQVVPPDVLPRMSRLKSKNRQLKAPSLSADDLAKRQEQETSLRQAMLASVKRRNSDRMVLRSKNEREDEVKDLKQLIDGLDNETKLHFIQYKLKQAIDKNTMIADDLGSQLIAELNQYQKLLCNIQKDRDAIAAAPLAEAPSLAVASIATTAISSVTMVGRKGPVLVGQIAAAKRTTRTTRKKSAVQPAASAHSVVGTRSSKRTNISSQTSSSKPAAKKRKVDAYDPLRYFNKRLRKKVLDRFSRLKGLQTKFEEIMMLAVKNQAVRDKICSEFKLSDAELDALLAGFNGEKLDRGTTSEELWTVFKLGQEKTHLSATIDQWPLLLHQEGIFEVTAWTNGGGKVSQRKESLSGLMISQKVHSDARSEDHRSKSEANGGSVGEKIALHCNKSTLKIAGTELTCRDLVKWRGENSEGVQKKGIVLYLSTEENRKALAKYLLGCDVSEIFTELRRRRFIMMGRNNKQFYGTANSRQGRELLSKPVVFKHATFAPGLTDETYRTCCTLQTKISAPKQPVEDMEFGLAGAERYVDGKGVTTRDPECRELSCCKKAITGYNGCCKAHSKAFAEWERRTKKL